MATFITGTSNFPGDYDVVPEYTGTAASVSFVLDQLRDPVTGVITQSGNLVIAEAINNIYTIVQAVEETLGRDPQDIFPSVTARMNYLQYSGSSAFVTKSGDTMFGTLNISGTGAEGLQTNYIYSSGGTWLADGNTSIAGSGSLNISSSGSLNLGSVNNVDVTSSSFIVNSDVTNIFGTGSVALSGGTFTLQSTGNITTYSDIVPNPSGTINLGSTGLYFDNIYVNSIHSTGLSESYLLKTGDTMLGSLTLDSGVDILNGTSGINSLGDLANPFSGIYSKNIYVTNIYGMSPVTFEADINLGTGSQITFAQSGTTDIGEATSPVGTLYADSVVADNISIAGYVTSTGSNMSGDLVMDSGVSIQLASGSVYPQTSGVGDIGTSTNYFDNVYTDNVNGAPVGNLVFGEVLTVSTGVLGSTRQFALQYPPTTGTSNGYAMIFVSGVLMTPGLDYSLTGNILTITGSMYTPATAPVAGMYIY